MVKYLKGALYIALSSLIAIANDVCMKMVSTNTTDTLFLRFLFATIILFPLILYYKPRIEAKSSYHHLTRALIFGLSMFFYASALKQLPLSAVIAVNFSIPLWVVILACLFLGEKWNGRLPAVLIGMLGVLMTCIPIWQVANAAATLVLILGAIGFASLDVFNKYLMNKKESMLMMLFGSSLGITLLYSPFFSYTIPNNIWPFVYLGIGANLLLYFILKAWQCCDISALQPIKYIEFPISIFLGAILFQDKFNWHMFLGVVVLLIGILINMHNEIKNKKLN